MKYLLIIFSIFIPAIAQSNEAVKINIFGESLNLPNYCELYAKRSIADNNIYFSCIPTHFSFFSEIFIRSAAQCEKNKFYDLSSSFGINVVSDTNKHNKWYYEYSIYAKEQEKFIYNRVVKDEKVCIHFTSSSKEALNNLSSSIWQ